MRLAVEVTRAVRNAGADFVQRLKDGKEIADINFEMLQPKATITNELAWRKRNAA